MRKTIIAIGIILSLSACGKTNILKLPAPPQTTTSTDIVINGQTIGKAPAPKIPALPASLAKKAGKLPELNDPTVAGQQKDAVETDRLYNDVAHQLNDVIDSWNCIMNAFNNEKDANLCFKGKVP